MQVLASGGVRPPAEWKQVLVWCESKIPYHQNERLPQAALKSETFCDDQQQLEQDMAVYFRPFALRFREVWRTVAWKPLTPKA